MRGLINDHRKKINGILFDLDAREIKFRRTSLRLYNLAFRIYNLYYDIRMPNVTSFKYYCNMWRWFVGFIMENQFIPDVFFI